MQENFLAVSALRKSFPVVKGVVWERKIADVAAVDGVSLAITKGETLGLAGESGSGKTTLGKCILQLDRPTSGEVRFEGVDVCRLYGEELRRWRRHAQLVYQDPYSSLNPRMRVGETLSEPIVAHGLAQGRDVEERIAELLTVVGLEPAMAERYPHMFSGGQRQRIAIARALATAPAFVVCDEPVSALDVSVQAQIVNLLVGVQEKLGLTMLFISHDLSLIRNVSHRTAIMYLGKIVEIAESDDLYGKPLHPYTQALLSAVPLPDPALERKRPRMILKGELPSPMNPPSGCAFHPRCPHAMARCKEETPVLKDRSGAHQVSCHLYD